MATVIIIFLLIYNIINSTDQELIRIKKFPRISFRLHSDFLLEKTNTIERIKNVNTTHFYIEYDRHFIKNLACDIKSSSIISPQFQKIIKDKKFRRPSIKLCKHNTQQYGLPGTCQYSTTLKHTFTEYIDTTKSNYLMYSCTLLIFGDTDQKNMITNHKKIYLIVLPKRDELKIIKKYSSDVFNVRCERNRTISPGKLVLIQSFSKNPRIKNNKVLFDVNNLSIPEVPGYHVVYHRQWIDIYFFKPNKKILSDIKLACYYQFNRGQSKGYMRTNYTFDIKNVNDISLDKERWNSFSPMSIEEAEFQCDLTENMYDINFSRWYKLLYIDKGHEVKNPYWIPVVDLVDEDFESSKDLTSSRIKLKKESLNGMPINTQSVWKLGFFPHINETIKCLLTFSTPQIKGSTEKIIPIKSQNDSSPNKLTCGDTPLHPMIWYYDNELLTEEELTSENSLHSSFLNTLTIKQCNEFTKGRYYGFWGKNPSIICHFTFQCIDKYYTVGDLKDMFDGEVAEYNNPKSLYEMNYQQYGIDKDDDPFLIYRPHNGSNGLNIIFIYYFNFILFNYVILL